MNIHLERLLSILQQLEGLPESTKSEMANAIKDADKEMEITAFKLDRTEKVKKTTAILLEETIEELESKRKAIEEANTALSQSLDELKMTQTQLIQAEKMASLGELTAGIAHEIQNPLNFVNNFSEVSHELAEEMTQALTDGNSQEALDIANDIKQNLEKILHHGKRADSIVKGMLQHSRSGSGQKEATDISVLADECLRLAYHGQRAKDKAFNVNLVTDFDSNLGMINVVPQDIGRVMLNMITNAFQALSAPKSPDSLAPKSPKGDLLYIPTVTVTTKLLKPPVAELSHKGEGKQVEASGGKGGEAIQISISDNGPGIPDAIKEKIFQPFFTTKPTGQGTGLGLSLSYDIIKAHGGEILVKTREGEGTTFTITLPV